jgi:hypothetical protein
MTSKCRHCGATIHYITARHSGALWYHPSTRSIYCNVDALKRGGRSTVAAPELVDADTGELR